MANPHRGEVSFKAGETTYKLDLTTNGICAAEAEVNCGIREMMHSMSRMTYARAILWAALLEHHPEFSEPKLVGPLIDAAGLDEVGKVLARGFTVWFPKTSKAPSKNG